MDRVSYGPFKLFESDAYKQAQAMQAEKQNLELEKLRLDMAEKYKEREMSSPSGRATMAADIAATLEQDKQKEMGIPLSEQMGSRMVEKGGPSILEAT
jgi:hypothetical protein